MQTNKPFILITSSALDVAGGLERMVVSLCNALAEKDYPVSLLIIGDKTDSFYPLLTMVRVSNLVADFGIETDRWYLSKKMKFIKDVTSFRKAVWNKAPHIVITTEYMHAVALTLAGKKRPYKIIHWQLSSFLQVKSRTWNLFFKKALLKVDTTICLNRDEQAFTNSLRAKSVVIANFTEGNQQCSDLSSKCILSISRLSTEKGIHYLLEAALTVLKDNRDWKWILVGSGPLEQEVTRFVRQNQLQDQLVLTKPVSADVSEAYLQASLYVLSSKRESFGMVLAEAMNHGVPCIAFDCETGPRHIIHHEVDGILVPKNNTAALAVAINNLVRDEPKRKALGAAAFENAKRFSKNHILPQWESLIHNIHSA